MSAGNLRNSEFAISVCNNSDYVLPRLALNHAQSLAQADVSVATAVRLNISRLPMRTHFDGTSTLELEVVPSPTKNGWISPGICKTLPDS